MTPKELPESKDDEIIQVDMASKKQIDEERLNDYSSGPLSKKMIFFNL